MRDAPALAWSPGFRAVAKTNFRIETTKPLTRPSATLSPSDGERDGVRGISEMNYGNQSSRRIVRPHRDRGATRHTHRSGPADSAGTVLQATRSQDSPGESPGGLWQARSPAPLPRSGRCRQRGADQLLIAAGKDMAVGIGGRCPCVLSAPERIGGFQQLSAADLMVTPGGELRGSTHPGC